MDEQATSFSICIKRNQSQRQTPYGRYKEVNATS